MKYGKKDIERGLRNFTSQKIEQKAGLTLVRLFIIGSLSLITFFFCITYGIMNGLLETAPDISNLNTAPVEAATYIYDENGEPLQKLSAPTSNRIPISIQEIPLDMQHAIVAIEDERFYEHNGIDVRGIIRAFTVGVRGGSFSEGASTITQQLLKNSVFTDWTSESSLMESFKRKFQEQYLAIQLESNLEKTRSKEEAKQQILEDYLNTINLGAGTYGVQAAAKRYFNKDASNLTLSECAVIAGITQNPTGFNPILYPEANSGRRKTVLNRMLNQGYITTSQFEEALSDDVYSRIQEISSTTDDTNSIYSYYTDALIEQVLEDLVNIAGYTSTQANHALFSGGLKVYSAQDLSIQQICDEEFSNPDNYPPTTLIGLDYALSISDDNGETINWGNSDVLDYFKEQDPDFSMMFADADTATSYAQTFKDTHTDENTVILGERISLIPQPQASCVIIDQNTGYVKAIVGGRGTKEASLTLNRATTTRRQPGSTFKPLAVYAPALEHGKTLASIYENAPYSYASGDELRNWDSDYGYSGYETIHTALTKSVNVIAVKLIEELTPETGLAYLENLGISTLYNGETDSNGNILSDAYDPLALGGIRDGVVNLELTAAFAAIANGGSYIEPKFYTQVIDSDGTIILENSSAAKQVFSEETAFLTTSAMQSVISDPLGTAYGYIDLGSMPAAGKTGTTDSAKDIWFEGYTPYLTCGIWGGYDNNDALPSDDKIYTSYAKVLWNSIMRRIHSNLEVKDFTVPETIVSAKICKKSGKLAVEGLCDKDPRGSQIMTEYFTEKTVPTTACSVHTSVKICSESHLVATSSCTKYTEQIYLKLPNGSSTETDDAQYAVPATVCAGHTDSKNNRSNSSSEDLSDENIVIEDFNSGDQNNNDSGAASQGIENGDDYLIGDGAYPDGYDFDSIPADDFQIFY